MGREGTQTMKWTSPFYIRIAIKYRNIVTVELVESPSPSHWKQPVPSLRARPFLAGRGAESEGDNTYPWDL